MVGLVQKLVQVETKLHFGLLWVGYNKLYAEQFYKQSDSTLKTNIAPLDNALETIMKVKCKQYCLSLQIE